MNLGVQSGGRGFLFSFFSFFLPILRHPIPLQVRSTRKQKGGTICIGTRISTDFPLFCFLNPCFRALLAPGGQRACTANRTGILILACFYPSYLSFSHSSLAFTLDSVQSWYRRRQIFVYDAPNKLVKEEKDLEENGQGVRGYRCSYLNCCSLH